MNSEKLTQVILGGFMVIAVISIGWFFMESNKQAAVEEALRKERGTASSTEKSDNAGSNTKDVKYSVDNANEPYKTIA